MRNHTTSMLATIFLGLALLAENAAGDLVLNVDARVNGSPGVFGPGVDVEQFLAAGDYTFTLVNNIGGHANFHSDANFTAWSFHTPGSNWGTSYRINFDDLDIFNNTRSSPPYAGPDEIIGGQFSSLPSALEAFDAAVASNDLTVQVHIPFDQTVGLYIPDNGLTDNAGGVSILITQNTIPEPSPLGLIGAIGIFAILRRRR